MFCSVLEVLQPFRSANDQESEIAHFVRPTPWVGPDAFLHIVYKGLDPGTLKQAQARLNLPPSYCNFLIRHNGLRTFSSALSVYGMHREGQLLNRANFLMTPPFNVESENSGLAKAVKAKGISVGGYGFDGTRAILEYETGAVRLLNPDRQWTEVVWPSIDDWICGELIRLSGLFTIAGHCKVEKALTVPRGAAG